PVAIHDLDLDTAKKLLADPLPTVRLLAVAACPFWRRADLYDIARDPAPAVRIAAIRHPNAADELLTDWQTDPDPLVATAAREAAETRARARASARPDVHTTRATPAAKTAPRPPAPEPPPKAGLDAAAPRPNLARSTPSAPAAAAAPDLFSKLKRFFWQ
ncbi:MAG: hypothetical protein LBK99_26860, partial [Opitutaceae bacterium]|nr:hypothetical protein [Opitutaceae bacterium]